MKKYKFPDSLKIQLTGPDIENTLINLNRNGKEYIGSIELPPNEESIVKEYQLSLFKNNIETLLNHTVTVEGAPIDYLVFESDTDMTINPKFTNTGILEYSTDKVNWNSINSGEETSSSKKLYFRGIMDSNRLYSTTTYFYTTNAWDFTNGTNVKISGNMNTLLNYNNPPTTVDNSAFGSMFYNKANISDINELKLPATTLSIYCYAWMFMGCTGITSIPATLLPATTLAQECYLNMFRGCTSLNSIPSNLLPATTLAQECYSSMFYNCTGLNNIPINLLPATTLANQCYQSMFQGCTGITSIPDNLLSATELIDDCYLRMFSSCSSLTNIPDNLLPATTLANGCYIRMFEYCTSLTNIPSNLLPSTILVNYCYQNMFRGCSSLVINTASSDNYSREFRIPASGTATAEANSLNDMFTTTAGTMNNTPEINTTYYTKD